MRETEFPIGDKKIAGIEFGDPEKPLSALWLHATGINAYTYRSILEEIGKTNRIAAIDLRGHGKTTLIAEHEKLKNWSVFRDDTIQWIEAHAPKGVFIGGHSMGGCVALLVAGKRPDLVKGMLMVDPVIAPRSRYFKEHVLPFKLNTKPVRDLASNAGKRRREFESIEAIREKYKKKPMFKTWIEPFFEDYLVGSFDPPNKENAKWKLRCPPKWESAIYLAQCNRPWKAMRIAGSQRIPGTIILGEYGSVMRLKDVERLKKLDPNLRSTVITGTTHFLAMERPELIVNEMCELIAIV